MPYRCVRYHPKHLVIAAAGHRALQGVDQGLCCACVSVYVLFSCIHSHSYPYTQYSIGTGTGNTKTNHSSCFFTDTIHDQSKPRRPATWCWETVTAASNHVRSLPVPSNQRGNGRAPPGALRELTDQGCTRVGSQPREVRHPVPRPMKPPPKPCSGKPTYIQRDRLSPTREGRTQSQPDRQAKHGRALRRQAFPLRFRARLYGAPDARFRRCD